MKTYKELISEIYEPNTPDAAKFINLHLVKTVEYPVENKDGLPFKDDSIKGPGPQHNKGPYHSPEETKKVYDNANAGTGESLHKEEWNKDLHEAVSDVYAKHYDTDHLKKMHDTYKSDIESLPSDAKYSTHGHLVDKEYHIRKALKKKGVKVERAKHELVIENLITEMKLVKTHENGNKVAKVYKDTEWGEYRVKHYKDGKHQTKADYHTDDKDDAHSTAQQWIKN